eukprot:721007-Amphidinium_carterae.1
MEKNSSNRLLNFDMVAELERAIVNRASQLWQTIVLMHRWFVHIEDYMDESVKSVEAFDIQNIQDAYVEEDAQYRDNTYPIQPTEDEADELENYNEITMSIRK